MSATILPFSSPYNHNDDNEYKFIANALSKAVKNIEQSSQFVLQLQEPGTFHPRDLPSIETYLKMSLVLMERASESVHAVLNQHRHIVSCAQTKPV